MSENRTLGFKVTGWKATLAVLAIAWCLGSGVMTAAIIIRSVW